MFENNGFTITSKISMNNSAGDHSENVLKDFDKSLLGLENTI